MRLRLLIGCAAMAIVTAGLAVPGASAMPVRPAASAELCTSSDPALAAELSQGIEEALRQNPEGIGLTVYDRRTSTLCTFNSDGLFYTASIIKVTIVGALLRRAQEEGRELTAHEKDLAYAAITRSDNDATSEIRDQIGNDGIQHFMDLAGMDDTLTHTSWGSYRTTPEDQVTLLKVLTSSTDVLTPDRRAYLLDLMTQVIDKQRWGVPAGAPDSLTVHVKNGWVPSAGWINSIGSFDGTAGGGQRDYLMAVLTGNSKNLQDGTRRIEAVAVVVHRVLNG